MSINPKLSLLWSSVFLFSIWNQPCGLAAPATQNMKTLASSAAADDFVPTKATVDRADFATHAIALRDQAVLAYYVRPGNGPTLVLSPGTHGDRSTYFTDEFLSSLDAQFGVVIIETRGQGRSWPPPTSKQATIESYADDVIEVVRHLKLTNWYISGHSLGGMTAIEIAGRKPAGLRGVITLEGWVHFRAAQLAFSGLPGATQQQKAEAQQQKDARRVSQRWTSEEYDLLVGMWRIWNHGEKIIRETEFPFLTLWGDRDLVVRPGREKLLLPDRGNVQIGWIAGSGHYITAPRHAGEVAARINRFVHEVESAHGLKSGDASRLQNEIQYSSIFQTFAGFPNLN